MEVLISHNEGFGLYSKYNGKLSSVLRRSFKKYSLGCQVANMGQEWTWKKENQLVCYCRRPGSGIGEYVFEKWLNVGGDQTSQAFSYLNYVKLHTLQHLHSQSSLSS